MIRATASLAILSLTLASPALAQQSPMADKAPPLRRVSIDPRAETMERLQKRLSLNVTEARLEDVMTFIREVTQASLEPMWIDDRATDGLDPDQEITIQVENLPAIALIERVLEKAQVDAFTQNTWQFTENGELQMGPKTRLNRYAYLKVYDINDLLFELPSFTEFPSLDLDSVLNQRQGGSSGSIFENEEPDPGERLTREQKTMDLIDIIINSIEPEQWIDAGGDAASVREYNGTLLVRAPDYIHRKLGGYSFGPSRAGVSSYPDSRSDRSPIADEKTVKTQAPANGSK